MVTSECITCGTRIYFLDKAQGLVEYGSDTNFEYGSDTNFKYGSDTNFGTTVLENIFMGMAR